MRESCPLSLHECLHAMVTARATIPPHTIRAKGSRAEAAKSGDDGVMAGGGETDTVGACNEVAADG